MLTDLGTMTTPRRREDDTSALQFIQRELIDSNRHRLDPAERIGQESIVPGEADEDVRPRDLIGEVAELGYHDIEVLFGTERLADRSRVTRVEDDPG
jgi:hypothetical protein